MDSILASFKKKYRDLDVDIHLHLGKFGSQYCTIFLIDTNLAVQEVYNYPTLKEEYLLNALNDFVTKYYIKIKNYNPTDDFYNVN